MAYVIFPAMTYAGYVMVFWSFEDLRFKTRTYPKHQNLWNCEKPLTACIGFHCESAFYNARMYDKTIFFQIVILFRCKFTNRIVFQRKSDFSKFGWGEFGNSRPRFNNDIWPIRHAKCVKIRFLTVILSFSYRGMKKYY